MTTTCGHPLNALYADPDDMRASICGVCATSVRVRLPATMRRSTPTALTTEQIEALRSEAGAAGDLEMVRVCDAALNGDEAAVSECARVIADARASEES